ncbi:hypothetical protein F5Y14DRAFT_437835 [Nemania sp. NC0429]|nr:hypothetical protein F5Y14DRAFT_437835 [Nemania sp. NC0429]
MPGDFLQVPGDFLQVPDSLPQVSSDPSQAPDLDIPQNGAPVLHGRDESVALFTCGECFESFKNNSELGKHGKATGHKPYPCNCGERFSRYDSIRRHLCSHGQPGAKHPCPVCTKHDGDRAFTRMDHLLQHLRGTHRFDEKGIELMRAHPRRTRRTRRTEGGEL